MKWNCENNVVTDDIINDVEQNLRLSFQEILLLLLSNMMGDIQYQIK